jgi:CRP/FNR family transcriptional regulator, cyclic AMP receptor protein
MRHRGHDEYLDRLATVPLFAGLDRDELEALASLGTDVDVAEGQELTRQAEIGHEAFLVLEGTARCIRDGEEVATFGPGDFFGEMALLAHGPRTATVVAVGPMVVRAFHQTEFNELLERLPRVAVPLLKTTAQRLLSGDHPPTH